MNTNELEDNQKTIEQYENFDREISSKLVSAQEIKEREESAQYLLKFELSRLDAQVNSLQRDVAGLEAEQDRLNQTSHELNFQLKAIKNYWIVHHLQSGRKEEWMQDLKEELNTLDFTIEERQHEPSRSIEAFTQVMPH